MIAFKVYVNGKQICLAGIGDLGVLTAHVCWVKRNEKTRHGKSPPLAEEELTMGVGGLVTRTKEYVRWHEDLPVQVGDEIRIKILNAARVDEPAVRKQSDPVKEDERRKQYVRDMAKQLGWKLQETGRRPQRK
jgi:hypothetical protein